MNFVSSSYPCQIHMLKSSPQGNALGDGPLKGDSELTVELAWDQCLCSPVGSPPSHCENTTRSLRPRKGPSLDHAGTMICTFSLQKCEK